MYSIKEDIKEHICDINQKNAVYLVKEHTSKIVTHLDFIYVPSRYINILLETFVICGAEVDNADFNSIAFYIKDFKDFHNKLLL